MMPWVTSQKHVLGTEMRCMVSVFTPTEIEYLQSQRLARLATVGLDGQPHVVPVSFRYNAEYNSN